MTRFLWLKDINQSYSRDNVQAYRFCRVIWGVICSAFLLASTILFHVGTYSSPIAEDISRNIYVDNLISGSTSHKDSVIYYEETKRIFNDASMNMCQWSSNNREFMKHLKNEDKGQEKELKALGIIWKVT